MNAHMTALPGAEIKSPILDAANAIDAVTKLCRTLIEQQHPIMLPSQDTSTEALELKQLVAEKRRAHQAAKDENARLLKLVERVCLERDSARSVVEEKLQTIAALEESIGARNSQIESMFDTAEEKSALIKELEAKVAELEGATTTPAVGRDVFDTLKQEKTKLTSRVQATALELENARAELQQARIDLAQAGEMHGKITAERDTITEKVTELEEKLAAAHAPGKDQEEKVKALDAEVIRLRGLNNDKTKELREARAQRKKLEAILTEKTTALDEAVAERDAAVGEARDLRDQGAVAPDQEIKLARAALGRAVRLLTNDADDYAFEDEDRVVIMLREAQTRLDGKAKA